LGRLIAPLLPAPIQTPQTLLLSTEPQADVTRYDTLREGRHGT
jgi:hypothetical protein